METKYNYKVLSKKILQVLYNTLIFAELEIWPQGANHFFPLSQCEDRSLEK